MIGGRSDAGPQGRAQTRTGKHIGIVIFRSATRYQTQGQQQSHQELRGLHLS